MRSKHYAHAASMVRAILAGEWTDQPPEWADAISFDRAFSMVSRSTDHYARAVLIAEAFILLFQQFSPKFDERLFLRQCGLLDSDARRI